MRQATEHRPSPSRLNIFKMWRGRSRPVRQAVGPASSARDPHRPAGAPRPVAVMRACQWYEKIIHRSCARLTHELHAETLRRWRSHRSRPNSQFRVHSPHPKLGKCTKHSTLRRHSIQTMKPYRVGSAPYPPPSRAMSSASQKVRDASGRIFICGTVTFPESCRAAARSSSCSSSWLDPRIKMLS